MMWEKISKEEFIKRKEEYESMFNCKGSLNRTGEPPVGILYEDTGKMFEDERKFLRVVYEWQVGGEIADDDKFFEYYEWRQP